MRDFLGDAPPGGNLVLDLEDQEKVATLWLDHARRRNAFSGNMMLQLEECVERLEKWEGSLLVLRGREGTFCAGADLRLMRSHFATPRQAAKMHDWMSELLERIRRSPFVSVALLEGAAMGGGAELAVSADHRVMVQGARIQFVQVERGVSPGWGGAARLRDLVGHRLALRTLTAGRVVYAEEAERMGLVDAVVSDANSGLREFIAPVLKQSAPAVRANKTALLPQQSGEEQRAMEKNAFLSVLERAQEQAAGTFEGPS